MALIRLLIRLLKLLVRRETMATKLTVTASAATDVTAVGGVAWTDPNNTLGATDAVYATVTPDNDIDLRSKLELTFDLSALPDDATVTGFLLVLRWGALNDFVVDMVDVRLGVGLVPTWSDYKVGLSTGDTPPSLSAEEVTTTTLGTCSDMWGLTPLVTDVKVACVATVATTNVLDQANAFGLDSAELSVYYEGTDGRAKSHYHHRRRQG